MKLPFHINYKKQTSGFKVGKRTKDLLTFLFFVVMSAIFWFTLELDENFGTEVVIPVRLVGVPNDVRVTQDITPHQLKVTVQGRRGNLLYMQLKGHTDTLRVKFNGVALEGEQCLHRDTLSSLIKQVLPSGVTLQNLPDISLSYCFVRGKPTEHPVALRGNINIDGRFCVDSILFEPSHVKVFAPSSFFIKDSIYTKKLDLPMLKGNLETEVELQTDNGVLVEPNRVILKVRLAELVPDEIVVPVRGTNFPASKTLRTFPSSVTFSYFVSEKNKSKISPDDFAFTITYDRLIGDTTGYCRPNATYPAHLIQDLHISDEVVEYLFETLDDSSPTSKFHIGKQKKGLHRPHDSKSAKGKGLKRKSKNQ